MSEARTPSIRRSILLGAALAVGVGVYALFAGGGLAGLARLPAPALHAPDLALIAAQPPAIRIHLAVALSAFLIGAVLLLGPKGTLPHRTLGWTWAAAMGTTAVSSFFIRELNAGGLSFIHAISGWTVVALPAALYAARRHRVKAHRSGMVGLYVGGMLVAGGFAFLPGRLMWRVMFG